MNVQTLQFVSLSAVFEGLPLVDEAFSNEDLDISYGDSNHTLIRASGPFGSLAPDEKADTLANIVNDLTSDAPHAEFEKQKQEVFMRLAVLPEGCYIDLET